MDFQWNGETDRGLHQCIGGGVWRRQILSCGCVCRVDGKEVLHLPQRRLSFDCKSSKFSQQSDILAMEKVSEGGAWL